MVGGVGNLEVRSSPGVTDWPTTRGSAHGCNSDSSLVARARWTAWLWDVGVERTVQISGPDADRLIDRLTCRDLTRCAVGQCKYMLVTAHDGGIVNDPVLLHVDRNTWWMQLADSDAGLYALGVLSQTDLDAEVSYPDVHPVQVQGPLAARTLEKLVGEAIYDLSYYWCDRFSIGDIPVVVSRTGWSAVPGFEVSLLDGTRGADLRERNIGYVWVPIDLAEPGHALEVDSEHGLLTGHTAAIPFVDPSKERPAQPLRGAA